MTSARCSLQSIPQTSICCCRLQIGLIDRSQIDPRRLMPTETGSHCHNVQRIEIDKNGTNLLARTGWESSVHLFLSIPAVMSPGHRSHRQDRYRFRTRVGGGLQPSTIQRVEPVCRCADHLLRQRSNAINIITVCVGSTSRWGTGQSKRLGIITVCLTDAAEGLQIDGLICMQIENGSELWTGWNEGWLVRSRWSWGENSNVEQVKQMFNKSYLPC